MKHKTSELTGALLDAAVAKANGWSRWPDGSGWNHGPDSGIIDVPPSWSPSTNRSDGGPIIERERVHIVAWTTGEWGASTDPRVGATINGPTPLIAAMRCFVARKLGDEVEL